MSDALLTVAIVDGSEHHQADHVTEVILLRAAHVLRSLQAQQQCPPVDRGATEPQSATHASFVD
jgi:hypothetical protein